MPSDRRHLNWVNTGFTPAGGTLIPLTGVAGVTWDYRANLLTHSGDGDRMPTTKVNDWTDPQVTVRFADANAQHGLAPGTRGAFSSTHQSARNLSAPAGGAYTLSLGIAIVGTNQGGGQHRQFADGTLMFETESVDGITSSMTFTVL